MSNPLNQLPTDPAWVKKVDEICTQASKELGCLVMLIAIQDGGKMGITVEGVPETGELAGITKDMPRFFSTLSTLARMSDLFDKHETEH